MSLSHELSKIKNSFSKVKVDMNFLADKISENYDDFIKHHKNLAKQIQNLKEELAPHLEKLKSEEFNNNNYSKKEILDLKKEIKDLKKELLETHSTHTDISLMLKDIKKNSKNIKDLKEKLHTNELEIFLLKDRIAEKDVEIKQMKDVNKHMFNVISDLSHIELEMINR